MSEPKRDRIALLTQQISHYHAARYRAAEHEFKDLRIYSLMNHADFEEFLSKSADLPSVVRIFDGITSYQGAVASGALWRRLHAELSSYVPDIVVVAGWAFPESLAAIAWARAAGARVVLISDSQFHDAKRSSWREAIKARVVFACDAALVSATSHRDYVVRLGIPAERIFFGHNTVDNDYFAAGASQARSRGAAARAMHGLPERYLLASGRFIEKKNFPRLVEGFAHALVHGDVGHDLVILGEGPERAAIEAAARLHGVASRVKLPGFRGYEDLPSYYGLADGFVHVALTEQWGLVINEAAASSLPLVVSRPCGAAMVLVEPGVNGYLVEPRDLQEISSAIHTLMSMSDETRVNMGAASSRIVADWAPERFARGLRAACDSALACQPRRLGLFDQVLFRMLAGIRISAVS